MWPLKLHQGISLIGPGDLVFLSQVTKVQSPLRFHQDKHSVKFLGQLSKK